MLIQPPTASLPAFPAMTRNEGILERNKRASIDLWKRWLPRLPLYNQATTLIPTTEPSSASLLNSISPEMLQRVALHSPVSSDGMKSVLSLAALHPEIFRPDLGFWKSYCRKLGHALPNAARESHSSNHVGYYSLFCQMYQHHFENECDLTCCQVNACPIDQFGQADSGDDWPGIRHTPSPCPSIKYPDPSENVDWVYCEWINFPPTHLLEEVPQTEEGFKLEEHICGASKLFTSPPMSEVRLSFTCH